MKDYKHLKENIYSNPINLPHSGHKLVTCHYPLRIDTYSGCYHDCKYCYGKSVLQRVNAWSARDIKVAKIDDIKQKLEYFFNKDPLEDSIAKALQNKVPVRLGAQTDCFQPKEREHRITYELIKYLNSIDYPYLIVTKSDLISEPEYLGVLRNDLAYVQMTITTLDEEKISALEPNAPPAKKR